MLAARCLEQAFEWVNGGKSNPEVILADYYPDTGAGAETIEALWRELGCTVPSLIITADRSERVKEEIGGMELAIMHKPLNLVVLRALLSQWRRSCVTAE